MNNYEWNIRHHCPYNVLWEGDREGTLKILGMALRCHLPDFFSLWIPGSNDRLMKENQKSILIVYWPILRGHLSFRVSVTCLSPLLWLCLRHSPTSFPTLLLSLLPQVFIPWGFSDKPPTHKFPLHSLLSLPWKPDLLVPGVRVSRC